MGASCLTLDILPEVLLHQLVTLREEGDVNLHELVVLHDPVLGLLYDVVPLEPMVPLLPDTDVGDTVISDVGTDARKLHLHTHAQGSGGIVVPSPQLEIKALLTLLPRPDVGVHHLQKLVEHCFCLHFNF